MSKPDYEALMREALREINRLRGELAEAKRNEDEAVAIIGMGCRLPGGVTNPQRFWTLLEQGGSASTEVPVDRWDVDQFFDQDPSAPGKMNTRRGCFLDEITTFDPAFFKISAREAESMDPQQRLLLEVSWEALESARIVPSTLFDSSTGVFIGICGSNYNSLLIENRDPVGGCDLYDLTGVDANVAAGRLSHFYGLTGPSVAVDTACSSSLVSLHLACQSLLRGECDLALSGGVNLILYPWEMVAFAKGGMLSADGRCKTFDAEADGYVRGEGCGVVILKRLSDALKNEDEILAVIRGSMVNHDGHSSGLTAPRGPAQVKVIRRALEKAGLEPDSVGYIEAHGTGTPLGDPIEIEALQEVFGKRGASLRVGSVKTNIGHLEAAAGIAGLLKVVLMLGRKEIPAHLHLKAPNPHIDWENIAIRIPTEREPWEGTGKVGEVRIAGLSSFGYSGTNAHVVIAEAPPRGEVPQDSADEESCQILCLSAQHRDALNALVQRYQSFLTETDSRLVDICYTANTRRTHFSERLAVTGTSREEVCGRLAKYQLGEHPAGVVTGQVQDSAPPARVAFMFTGQGCQYRRMGYDLYQSHSVFRAALDECHAVLSAHCGWELLPLLYPKSIHEASQSDAAMGRTEYSQPSIFALEFALSQVWQSWGVMPSAVMGHSVGEYVAACVAGVFTLEDGLKLVAERGRLMQGLPSDSQGEMFAVFCSRDKIETVIRDLAQVSIAAVNAPEEIVLSGDAAALAKLVSGFEENGIRCQKLLVSHAFHSPLMEPMMSAFSRTVERVSFSKPTIDFVSNLTGEFIPRSTVGENDGIASAEYWVKHVRDPVLFAEGVQVLRDQGVNVFLEVGPKPVLSVLAKQCLARPSTGVGEGDSVVVSTLHPDRPNRQTMLESLSSLHVSGVKVEWEGVHSAGVKRTVDLPTYPWRRQSYWIQPRGSTSSGRGGIREGDSFLNQLEREEGDELVRRLRALGQLSPEASDVLPEVIGLLARYCRAEVGLSKLRDWLYEVGWQSQPLPGGTGSRAKIDGPVEEKHWLILADQMGCGDALARELRGRKGHIPHLVYAGLPTPSAERMNSVSDPAPLPWIDPLRPEEFAENLRQLPHIEGIIHLWSLDIPKCPGTAEGVDHLRLGCGALLSLVQAAVELDYPAPRVTVVTKGAQATRETDAVEGLFQSPVQGMVKVLAMELAEFRPITIDFEVEGTVEVLARRLAEEIEASITGGAVGSEFESQVAWRGENRYVARLNPCQERFKSSSAVGIRSDGTYLITGGLGGLGLLVARWLVDRGARRLVLLGRSEPKPAAELILRELEKTGAVLDIMQVDVGKLDQVAEALEKIDPDYPLKGIIHAAGTLDDGTVLQQRWERFERVFEAKVKGAWHLHTLSENMELDFFICFASTAGSLGNAGQANYAAANAFLDSFAHYRNARNLPTLAIDWDAWSEVGMAARMERPSAAGEGPELIENEVGIAPELGLQILGWLLDQTVPQVVVVSSSQLIRGRFGVSQSFYSMLPWQQRSVSVDERKPSMASISTVLEELHEALPCDRESILVGYLQKQVGAVLRSKEKLSLQQPFAELGMDSLMTVELRQALQASLQVQLPGTLAFDYPTVERLAKFLLTRIDVGDRRTDPKLRSGKEKTARQEAVARGTEERDSEERLGTSTIEAELSQLESLMKELGDSQE